MSGKRFRQVELITSLDELEKCEWVTMNGRLYRTSRWSSFQLMMAEGYVKRGLVYAGIRT